MKILWYIVSIMTLLLILANNTKSNSFGNFSNPLQLANYTRSTQKNMQILTVFSISIFLLSTILIVADFSK